MRKSLLENLKDYNNSRQEHVELVCEELIMYSGLKCKVVKNEIHLDTIAKLMIYKCTEETVMGDVYRFLSNYGSIFHYHFLSLKIQESRLYLTK